MDFDSLPVHFNTERAASAAGGGRMRAEDGVIYWPPLFRGILQRRYKRFLADVQLSSGEEVTAHCPNSGSMKGCSEAGRPVYVSYHPGPGRKLSYTWELIEMPGSLVGINTLVPNRLAAAAIRAGRIPPLSGYDSLRPEVRAGAGSRLDLMLSDAAGGRCWVEIKNCTLVAEGAACFPDAVTARGRQHLVELQSLAARGDRCVMFFLIQRMDAGWFRPADGIDPAYGRELRRAMDAGVEILAYDAAIDLEGIRLRRPLPVCL
jgi:sugar fermentation stimulation protein A